MRWLSLFIAALFCLPLAAHPSASADEAKDAKDKSAEWTDGSVWEAIMETLTEKGKETTTEVTFEVTKRDGKSFAGRESGGKVILEFEGEVNATGKITLTITKIAEAPEAWRKGPGRNVVGLKQTGLIDAKSVTLKTIKRDPDHPATAASISIWKLKLKEDK